MRAAGNEPAPVLSFESAPFEERSTCFILLAASLAQRYSHLLF